MKWRSWNLVAVKERWLTVSISIVSNFICDMILSWFYVRRGSRNIGANNLEPRQQNYSSCASLNQIFSVFDSHAIFVLTYPASVFCLWIYVLLFQYFWWSGVLLPISLPLFWYYESVFPVELYRWPYLHEYIHIWYTLCSCYWPLY